MQTSDLRFGNGQLAWSMSVLIHGVVEDSLQQEGTWRKSICMSSVSSDLLMSTWSKFCALEGLAKGPGLSIKTDVLVFGWLLA